MPVTQKPSPLVGKQILIISPQAWGTMHISKHHYALELAKQGNTVYFLNPPMPDMQHGFESLRHEGTEGLFLVSYRPFFNFIIRYRVLSLYRFLIKLQIRYLLRRLKVRFDLVWCFDTNLYLDLKSFQAGCVVYHVVDQISHPYSLLPAKGADLLISVADEIMESFKSIELPKLIINHGLSSSFAELAARRLEIGEKTAGHGDRTRVGYVGNLLIESLDRDSLKTIIQENPDVEFCFWGSYDWRTCNISGEFIEQFQEYITFLQGLPNVRLLGPKAPEEVALQIQDMDAFLICYDLAKDVNNGCNSHKILEYLSTGKVVIANSISCYQQQRHLIRMCGDPHSNHELPALFRETVENLQKYNHPALQKERIELSLHNSYISQIDRVADFMASCGICPK